MTIKKIHKLMRDAFVAKNRGMSGWYCGEFMASEVLEAFALGLKIGKEERETKHD